MGLSEFRSSGSDAEAARPAPAVIRPSLTANLIANVAGKAWASLLGLLFVPVYVRLMGIESYGLVGIYVSLTALLSVLDLGLSPTLSRELARLGVAADARARADERDLVRTFEAVFWAVGLCLGVLWALLSPVVAHHWVGATRLAGGTVERAFLLMGVLVAVQWPSSVYDGGLTGLERQIRLNAIRISMGTIQSAGAAVVLWLVAPSILVYVGWQALCALAQTLLLRHALWGALPGDERAEFRRELLARHARFAAGMTGISVLAIVLTQTDKVILSRLLPLETFGYYVLASSVASVLTFLVAPAFAALFPRFTQLFASGADEASIASLYHGAAQAVATLSLPAAGVLVAFGDELLLIWTRDPVIVTHSAPFMRLLAIGSGLNAVMVVPYLLQVSYGWTRLAVVKNVVAVTILVPLLVWGVQRYGAICGPIAWVALNAGYVLVEVPVMHRRLLSRERWAWYRRDLALPVATVAAVAGLSRLLAPRGAAPLATFAWIAVTGLVALAACAAVMPATRAWLEGQVRRT